jgi:ATP:ADP antiporter, AAA family
MHAPDAPQRQPDRGLRAGELGPVALAGAAFFLILCSHYVLRPVRDEMGVRTGVEKLQWLFTGTFVFTLLTVPVFGWVARVVPRRRLLAAVYAFLVVNLLAFAAAFGAGAGVAAAAAFFIWLSVFNLFVVSLFWSNVSDVFSKDQSHRLYGYVAAGGTAGALAGPALTRALAPRAATWQLLALSAALLAAGAVCVTVLRRRAPAGTQAAEPIGGNVLAGISLTVRRPDLRGVAVLVICYSAVSTVLYVELIDLVGRRFAGQASGQRTAFFATVDLGANLLALTLQLLGTRQIVMRWGLRAGLSLVPLVVTVGLGLLAVFGAWRSAALVAALQIANRAGDYALMRPGREMIFTTVHPESRYKAKSFIDTTVYRANDAASAWVVSAVRAAGRDPVTFVGMFVALLWLVTGFRIGRRHDQP